MRVYVAYAWDRHTEPYMATFKKRSEAIEWLTDYMIDATTHPDELVITDCEDIYAIEYKLAEDKGWVVRTELNSRYGVQGLSHYTTLMEPE